MPQHRERVKDYRDGLREVQAEIQSGGRSKFWKPRQLSGKKDPDEGNRIRIIVPPYMEPDPEYGVVISPWVKYRQYRIPGVNGKVKMVVVPSDFGQPDPIGDWIADLEEGNSRDREKAKSLSKRQRYIALIVDLDENPNEIVPWEFGPQVADQIVKYALHRSYNLPWDTEEGHDLWVRMWGHEKDTEYEVIPEPRPSPLPNAEKLLKQANKIDLAKFIVVETEETLEDILDGKYDKDAAKDRRDKRDKLHGRPFPFFTDRGDDGDEDDEEPSGGIRGGSRRKPAKDVEEADEAPPARSRRAPAAREPEPEPEPVQASASRRRRSAPEPEPEEPSGLVLGAKVKFQGDNGQLTGTITELHLDDKDPYVTVDAGDGDEPWDVNVDEVELVAEEAPEPEPEEEDPREARNRRRREREAEKRAAARGEAAEEPASEAPVRRSRPARSEGKSGDSDDEGSVNKTSIVDRVSQLSRNARGER